MTGLTCEFFFNSPWKGLIKNVTFRAGNTSKTLIDIKDDKAVVPKVVLDEVGAILYIGVEGFSPSGPLEISTIYAPAGKIRQGASVEEQEDVPEIWQQIYKMAENAQNLANQWLEDGVCDGGYI